MAVIITPRGVCLLLPDLTCLVNVLNESSRRDNCREQGWLLKNSPAGRSFDLG